MEKKDLTMKEIYEMAAHKRTENQNEINSQVRFNLDQKINRKTIIAKIGSEKHELSIAKLKFKKARKHADYKKTSDDFLKQMLTGPTPNFGSISLSYLK